MRPLLGRKPLRPQAQSSGDGWRFQDPKNAHNGAHNGAHNDARNGAPEGVEVVAVVPGKVDSRRAFYADNLEIF